MLEGEKLMTSKSKRSHWLNKCKQKWPWPRRNNKAARWQVLQEDEKHKATIEERRVFVKKKVTVEIIAEENKMMMVDPREMHVMEREWPTTDEACEWWYFSR
jgi:hypothetical protein